MTTVVEIIASVVGIIGGLSLAFGGWSSLSLGARSLFVTTQFISGFAMYVQTCVSGSGVCDVDW